MVPAEAEIIIEGYVSTRSLEPEAPFGESHGHVNLQDTMACFHVTASHVARTRCSPDVVGEPGDAIGIKLHQVTSL